jgi:hypothetical protein
VFQSALLLLPLFSLALSPSAAGTDGIRADRLRELTGNLELPAKPRRSIPPTKVTLDTEKMTLDAVLRALEKQTGNRIVDQRETDGDTKPENDLPFAFKVNDEPYWAAVDKLLDAANLAVAEQSGEAALAIVAREPGDGPRFGPATYAGAFRVEALDVNAHLNARNPHEKSLTLRLQIAWEPRLRPLSVTQAQSDLSGSVDNATPLLPNPIDPVFGSEVPLGTQVVDLWPTFSLPPRRSAKITSLQGKLRVLVPTRQARFEFADLAKADGKAPEKVQKIEDTEIVVDRVQKNNEVWELHMRLRLDKRNPVFKQQRSWIFDNPSYLVDAKGEKIDNAGFETTSESEHEIGVAYFFDNEGTLDGMKWVYETPVGIAETEIDYELNDIELP